QVLTAVAVARGSNVRLQLVATKVLFRPLNDAEIRAYWQTGEPADKAGAYGIQGLGAVFVEHIEGSYSAVVGLPLAETALLLAEFAVPCWQLR
ncbi:MAG: Maf family protein, partial [Pseudomonas sp.]